MGFSLHEFQGLTNNTRSMTIQEQERTGRKVRKKKHGKAQGQRMGAIESH